MSTTEQISPTRAMVLEKVGQGIEFDHLRQKLILVGRTSNNMGPRRIRHIKARDVFINTANGCLTGEGRGTRKVAEVIFTQGDERIISLVDRR